MAKTKKDAEMKVWEEFRRNVYPAHARDLLPVVGVQRALPSHARVVHQDRHRTQLCFCAGHHGFNRGGLRNVRRHRDPPPTRGRNLSNQCLGRVRMRSIVHAYGGAALRQEPRRCSARVRRPSPPRLGRAIPSPISMCRIA